MLHCHISTSLILQRSSDVVQRVRMYAYIEFSKHLHGFHSSIYNLTLLDHLSCLFYPD